jgi:hypothetical protein
LIEAGDKPEMAVFVAAIAAVKPDGLDTYRAGTADVVVERVTYMPDGIWLETMIAERNLENPGIWLRVAKISREVNCVKELPQTERFENGQQSRVEV